MEENDIIHQIPTSAGRIGVITSGDIEEVSIAGYTENVIKSFKNPWEEASEIHFIWMKNNQ